MAEESERSELGSENDGERQQKEGGGGGEEEEAEEDDDDEARKQWLKHYSANHKILFVGEGDFSFSSSLATAFRSASNIVATSLDRYDALIKMYKKAKSNMVKLNELGALLLHGVDATRMRMHPDLRARKFDRIIFNFPHAGFHGKENHSCVVSKHRTLLQEFFGNASRMLRADGEVHVNHKTNAPYSYWNLEYLALQSSLVLVGKTDFNIEDYPGYSNKQGDGSKCDEPFHLGACSTFKFRFCQKAMLRKLTPAQPQQIYESSVPKHRQSQSFETTIKAHVGSNVIYENWKIRPRPLPTYLQPPLTLPQPFTQPPPPSPPQPPTYVQPSMTFSQPFPPSPPLPPLPLPQASSSCFHLTTRDAYAALAQFSWDEQGGLCSEYQHIVPRNLGMYRDGQVSFSVRPQGPAYERLEADMQRTTSVGYSYLEEELQRQRMRESKSLICRWGGS